MNETIYVIRTAEYPTVTEAIEDGAVYTFEIPSDPENNLLWDFRDCIRTVSRCIDSDMNRVQGFIKVGDSYLELGDYCSQPRD